MLAEKISGTHVGLWLLIPEHIRLGTWDLLSAWTGIHDPQAINPRLALQLVHESALCVNGVRQRRTLRQKGFELLNGLPFVATDTAIHKLLDQHTMKESLSLQEALGHIRYLHGHYPGNLILIDPHRIRTWSKRHMPPKKTKDSDTASKVMQTFFAIDGTSSQPLGCGIGSSTVTVTHATLRLVDHLATIVPNDALLVADAEHFTVEILHSLVQHPQFTFLIPAPRHKRLLKKISTLPFKPLWAGYAVAESAYEITGIDTPLRVIAQRTGEREDAFEYKPFVTSSTIPADELMTLIFPDRWNIEEFFNTECYLGWNRASTFNLNIRSGKLSLALIAQAVIYQLRQKLPDDLNRWTANSIAQKLFSGIDGDIRVKNDTIIVTLYNMPYDNFFKEHYEHLPQKLEAEGLNPKIPWLYNFKVDFKFK